MILCLTMLEAPKFFYRLSIKVTDPYPPGADGASAIFALCYVCITLLRVMKGNVYLFAIFHHV
jgi:hypothetical protein